VTAIASADCTLNGAFPSALAVGGVCPLTATYTPTTFVTTTDTATFNGNLSNAALSMPPLVQLTLTGPATPPASTIALNPFSPSSPVYGQTITVSATVSGPSIAPAGTVVFTVDSSTISVSLVEGTAATSLTGLNAGAHTISAAYTSSNGFAPSSTSATTLTIAKAPTATTFSANPASPVEGESDTLTATVTGAGQLGGTVVFTSGSTTLCTATLNASGVGSCPFIPTTDNNLTVTAQYQGDTNQLPSSSSQTLFVYDSAVKLQLSSTQLVYPGATNLTACITPATATGSVQIYDGSTLLTTLTVQGGGCAYWYISPGLSTGTHSLTAVYSGNNAIAAGTSVPVLVTVSPVPVTLSASCWNASFAYGASYQCTVNLSSNAGTPLGSITYTVDAGSPIAVPLSNGNAQFTLATPNVGTHSVVIGYAQQTNYASAIPQTETFRVTPAPVNVSLTPSSWYTTVGTNVTFQAAVASWSAGPPNATGSVSFYNGSTLLSTVPVNASGQATYATSGLSVGTHAIAATYAGGTNYASGSSSVTITVAQ
jgi:hypothetical protein